MVYERLLETIEFETAYEDIPFHITAEYRIDTKEIYDIKISVITDTSG